MNYARGFKRLYTVASVCWIVFWLWVASMKDSDTNMCVVIAFVVPAAAYVLFFLVFPWVGRGFK